MMQLILQNQKKANTTTTTTTTTNSSFNESNMINNAISIASGISKFFIK